MSTIQCTRGKSGNLVW